jgi:hypothetical protein
MNKILDAEDILAYARDHIECVFMAPGQLTHEECPIQVVAETASKKIKEAIALLSEYRKSGDAPVPVAPSAKPKSRPARTKRSGK